MALECVTIGDATLYRADWRAVLPGLPDGSVDLVCADPPYPGLEGGVTSAKAGVASTDETVTVGDLWGADLEWMPQAWRIARLGMLSFCTHHSVADLCAQVPERLYWIALWRKRNAPRPARNAPRYDSEVVLGWKKAPGLRWKALESQVLDHLFPVAGCMATERILLPGSGKAAHPTQKPLAALSDLLAICAPGMSVLDPMFGTGTTAVQCAALGLPFIGCERDPRYFDIACRRLEARQAQSDLFAIPHKEPA